MVINSLSSVERIEFIFRKLLPYFFLVVLITTYFAAYVGYYDHNAFKIGGWLINYQGGFVRRGLLGEGIYQLALITNLNVGFLAFLLQCFSYTIFLGFSYLILQSKKNILLYLLLIVSPFVFLFQLNDMGGGFRKEVIYFGFLSILVYSLLNQSLKIYNKIFIALMLLYPTLILTHEVFAVFLPYLLIINFYFKGTTNRVFIYSLLLSLPSAIAFAFSLHYKGSVEVASAIFKSLENVNYSVSGGAIEWLEYDVTHGIRRTINHIENHDYLLFYSQVLILCFFSFVPLYRNILDVLKIKINLLLFLISIIGTLPLFYVALDWGRFIYIHMVSIFFLSLLSCERGVSLDLIFKKYIFLFVVVFVLYTQSWHIHHCCNANPYIAKYTDFNILSFLKPYVKTYQRLSE